MFNVEFLLKKSASFSWIEMVRWEAFADLTQNNPLGYFRAGDSKDCLKEQEKKVEKHFLGPKREPLQITCCAQKHRLMHTVAQYSPQEGCICFWI